MSIDQDFQSISPFGLPTASTSSRWVNDQLVWTINGRDIGQLELESWCYVNLNYPWCYVDVVRRYHCDAWASKNAPYAPN